MKKEFSLKRQGVTEHMTNSRNVNPTNITVLDNLNLLSAAQEKLRSLADGNITFPTDDYITETEMIARTGSARAVLISPRAKITASYLEACPTIQYVGLCGTSTANINLDELQRRGIAFTNVVDYGDEPTAEFIFMQLMCLMRGVGDYQWQKEPRELMGKHIGIIGLGALGQAIAHLALAYKMDVRYYSTHRKHEWEDRGLHYADKADLLNTSQIVVLSGPTNIELLGETEFELIQPDSILIQASMGNVFDRQAFLKWIARDGNFALFDYAAGKANYQAYKDLPRVMFPKVVAGYTQETKARLGDRVYENLKHFLKSEQGGADK